MKLERAMAALEAAGSAQNRKVYGRHGVAGPAFGVSFAALGKLRRQIGRDHALAQALWASGNHDARILATMIADPEAVGAKELDLWVADLADYVVCDALSKLAAASPHARAKFEKWTKSELEFTSSAGWTVLAVALMAQRDDFPEAEHAATLRRIEREIRGAPNRTRHAMNNALIAIGCVSEALEKQAIAAAKRIGTVDVDHGQTGCKTPDAASYIPKARAYAAKRQAKVSKRPAVRSPGKAAALARSRATKAKSAR